MGLIRLIRRVYFRVTTPAMWIRNYKSIKKVDDVFRWIIKNKDNLDIKIINRHKIEIGGEEIWISNKYYASPSLFYPIKIKELPHADTTIEFFRMVDIIKNKDVKHAIEKHEKEYEKWTKKLKDQVERKGVK